MSKILVTGGLGLIGHHVVHKLQKLNQNVVVTDIKTNYGIIPQDEIDYLMTERMKKIPYTNFYRYDICDYRNMEYLFASNKFDTIIHMASFPRQKVVNANPIWGSQVMSEGLLNLLELSKKFKVKKFIYISSSMVYGDFTDDVTEDYNCKPQGQYGILKLAGEHLVKDYTRRGCFDHVIIRPSAVYGPLDVEDRVIAKFMLTAMRGGVLKVNGATETLDFTYVEDAAEGIVRASLSENTNNKTYNITKSHSRSLLYAAELAVKIAGKGTIEVQDKDVDFPSRGALNIDSARKDFDYDPKVDVEEGFQLYYDWLNNSPFWSSKTKQATEG
jgi:nucleoside-diphosphate-sugar epimerase